jgi:D-glycero-D-manno-heptose 1,7-bisphosphate phosphatase
MKALFFDRDGVLNDLISRDGGWYSPRSLEEFCVSDSAAFVVNGFRSQGFTIFVVTNQPDISRGILQPKLLQQFHSRLVEQLGPLEFLVCPHTVEENCGCRKPKPDLITKACSDYMIDVSVSWLIGDQISDLIAGNNAGLNSLLLHSPATPASLRQFPGQKIDFEVFSLVNALTLISGF